jgi:hypothetical protein
LNSKESGGLSKKDSERADMETNNTRSWYSGPFFKRRNQHVKGKGNVADITLPLGKH